MSAATGSSRFAGRGPGLALVAVIGLVAFNLRPAATTVGPLLRELQADLGMSGAVAGVLTSLPTIAFGVVGLGSGWLARRFGVRRSLGAALALLTIGLAGRAVAPDAGWLLAGTALAVVGIAVGNVLLPIVVKRWFPRHVGRVTGVYAMTLSAGAAISAAATVPLAAALGGWRPGLGVWAVPALAALLAWVAASRSRRARTEPPSAPAGRPVPVHRSGQAWALTVFFGIQALEAYTMMGWLPTILQDAGLSASYAGVLLGITMGLGAPMALLIPELAARSDDQRVLAVGLTLLSATAYLGLLLAPAAAPLVWVLLLGVGQGAFPLTLVLLGLRSSTARGTADLSALVQGVGYLVAASGPFVVGVLYDVTGSWTLPLLLLIVLLVIKLGTGAVAGRPGVVDQRPEAPGSPLPSAG